MSLFQCALTIAWVAALQERFEDVELIELAALLHDVKGTPLSDPSIDFTWADRFGFPIARLEV